LRFSWWRAAQLNKGWQMGPRRLLESRLVSPSLMSQAMVQGVEMKNFPQHS
jgi:hypothetical protein